MSQSLSPRIHKRERGEYKGKRKIKVIKGFVGQMSLVSPNSLIWVLHMQETADTGSFVPLKYITESFYLNNILLEKVKDFRSLSQSE